MAKVKRKTKIVQALNSLDKTDIYSMMMFILWKLRDDPEFANLSESCYLFDGKSLSRFLAYYGGMTIKVPTLRDMRLVLKALTLYQYVNSEEGTFEEGLKGCAEGEFSEEELIKTYNKAVEVIDQYDFKRN